MKYVFPCIITKEKDVYNIAFPDFENRMVDGSDLYDTLKAAHNILLLDLYVKESQRIVICEPTPVEKIQLAQNQSTSYIICDTDVFSNMLDFYDNIEIDDLEAFLKEKTESVPAIKATVAEVQPKEIVKEVSLQENAVDISDNNELFGYEDDIEVFEKADASNNDSDISTDTKDNELDVVDSVVLENDFQESKPRGNTQEKSSQKPIKHYNNYRRKSNSKKN